MGVQSTIGAEGCVLDGGLEGGIVAGSGYGNGMPKQTINLKVATASSQPMLTNGNSWIFGGNTIHMSPTDIGFVMATIGLIGLGTSCQIEFSKS